MPDARVATTADPDVDQDGLMALNGGDTDHARTVLAGCCAARRWVSEMVSHRPYASPAALLTGADAAFDQLSAGDWREAFAAHARIGAPRPGDARGAGEQAGAASATPQQLQALRDGNERYEARFGHVFLIRAAGLDAEQMLAALHERLGNTAERELEIAAAQQREITRLRLNALVARP